MKKMIKILIIPILISCIGDLFAQEAIEVKSGEEGIRLEDNQVFVSQEFKRLLTDSLYRTQVYPSQYQFDEITSLLADQKEHLALWYLINLYEIKPLLTLQITKDLSAHTIQSEDFVTAFYSYAYTDPRVVEIKDGSYFVQKPELLDRQIKVTNLLASVLNKWKNS